MSEQEQQEWMSVIEAAAYLGVTRRAIHNYIQHGKLPAYKAPVGARTLLKSADVVAYKAPRRALVTQQGSEQATA